MFECYLDGQYIRTFDYEEDAERWCEMYDGDKESGYEYIGESGYIDDISDCGPF